MNEDEWLSCTDPTPMLDYLRTSGKPTDRQAGLFAAACCRRVQHLLTESRVRHCPRAIETRERHADGLATQEEVRASVARAAGDAMDAGNHIAHPGEVAFYAIYYAAVAVEQSGNSAEAACMAARAASYDAVVRAADATVAAVAAAWEAQRWQGRDRWNADEAAVAATPTYQAAYAGERATQAALLRCIASNPFRPLPPLDPSLLRWNGDTAKRLAEVAYEQRVMPDGTLDNSRLAVLADALEEAGCTDADILGHLRSPGPHARGCFAIDAILGRK
jgi:hypothetical protein